jgi:hypothetical protein
MVQPEEPQAVRRHGPFAVVREPRHRRAGLVDNLEQPNCGLPECPTLLGQSNRKEVVNAAYRARFPRCCGLVDPKLSRGRLRSRPSRRKAQQKAQPIARFGGRMVLPFGPHIMIKTRES